MERLDGVQLTDLAAIRSITTADPEQTLIKCVQPTRMMNQSTLWPK